MIYCKIAVIVLSIIGFFINISKAVGITDPEERQKGVITQMVAAICAWLLYYGCGIFDLWPEN